MLAVDNATSVCWWVKQHDIVRHLIREEKAITWLLLTSMGPVQPIRSLACAHQRLARSHAAFIYVYEGIAFGKGLHPAQGIRFVEILLGGLSGRSSERATDRASDRENDWTSDRASEVASNWATVRATERPSDRAIDRSSDRVTGRSNDRMRPQLELPKSAWHAG